MAQARPHAEPSGYRRAEPETELTLPRTEFRTLLVASPQAAPHHRCGGCASPPRPERRGNGSRSRVQPVTGPRGRDGFAERPKAHCDRGMKSAFPVPTALAMCASERGATLI